MAGRYHLDKKHGTGHFQWPDGRRRGLGDPEVTGRHLRGVRDHLIDQ